MHWSSKVHDVCAAALGISTVAVSHADSLEQWLKILMLVFTIIFLALGCVMRYLKIRAGKLDDDS